MKIVHSGRNNKCRSSCCTTVVVLLTHEHITIISPEGRPRVLNQPKLFAAHKSLSFYSSGVYFEPKCGNTLDDLDHAVLAVGYGEINGEKFWLVKNSWSNYWGNDGYVLMSQKDNNCGVATAASYVNLK